MDHDLLTSLLPEIVPTVFEFLSLEDRKNMRLTCRSFRNLCNQPKIIKKEKFVFHFGLVRNDIDATRLAEQIERCEYFRTTVEFRAVNLTLQPLMSVWRTFGDEITSLYIHNCILNDEIVEQIFMYCSQLVNIHLNVVPETELFHRTLNALDKLIALGIKRPMLQSFEIFTVDFVSDDTFRKMFTIFPNIRSFSRGPCNRTKYEPFRIRAPRWPYHGDTPIELPPLIENFVNGQAAGSTWMIPYIRHPTLKFKELEFTFLVRSEKDVERIIELISSHTELKRLGLRIPLACGETRSVKVIFFQILRKLRKLEALKFHTEYVVEFADVECADLLAMICDLKSLDLNFRECAFRLSTTHRPLPSVVYPQLTHLSLNFGRTSVTEFQSEILNRCRSLQSLSLSNVDDETMKLVCRDHTELRELTLDCTRWRNITHLEEYSLDRLQKLEYLDLRNVIPNYSYSNDDDGEDDDERPVFVRSNGPTSLIMLASKLRCPKLKVFLSMEREDSGLVRYLSDEDTMELLDTLALRTPQLETLQLCSMLPIEDLPCEDFHKLHHLVGISLNDNDYGTDGTSWPYRQLFESCSTLKYVVNNRLSRRAKAYFYDRIAQSLVIRGDETHEDLWKTLDVPYFPYA